MTEREIAKELFNNFEEITGYKKSEVVNEYGDFREDMIDKTIDNLVEYGYDNFGLDITYNDSLYILDDLLVSSQAVTQ